MHVARLVWYIKCVRVTLGVDHSAPLGARLDSGRSPSLDSESDDRIISRESRVVLRFRCGRSITMHNLMMAKV